MNRYIVNGLAVDLLRGRRVALVGPRRTLARQTFLDTVNALPEGTARKHFIGVGREHVEMHNGGRLDVLAAHPSAARGKHFDVMVVLHYEDLTEGTLEALTPALTPDGEVVRN